MSGKSPHEHWSQYDENLEMKRFEAMHAKLADGNLDVAIEAGELRDMARSSGYGQADSHLTDISGRDPDDGYTKALQEVFEGYMDGDYWNCIDGSENIFHDALGQGPALDAARAATDAMRAAFTEGREMRVAEEDAKSPSP